MTHRRPQNEHAQVIAYNLCYSTCLGRPAHARAGEALHMDARTGGTAGGAGSSHGAGASAAGLAGDGAPAGAGEGAGQQVPAAAVIQGIRLGATSGYYVPRGTLRPGGMLAPDKLVISPNGIAYAPHSARQVRCRRPR